LRWAGHVTGVRELRNAYKILIRKCEGKKLFIGRDDNIKVGLKRNNMGRCGLDYCGSALGKQWWAFVDAVMNIWVSQKAANFMSSWQPVAVAVNLLYLVNSFCLVRQ
jgi:hypothetical protein